MDWHCLCVPCMAPVKMKVHMHVHARASQGSAPQHRPGAQEACGWIERRCKAGLSMTFTWECRYEALRVELPQLLMAPATCESGNVVHGCMWHLQRQRACTLKMQVACTA